MVISVEDHGLAYSAVPKAGCSSVKAMLAEVDPKVSLPPEQERSGDTWHSLYPTRRWRGDVFSQYSKAFRFTVVRDPIKRLMSVYTNRVVDKKDLHKSRKLQKRRGMPMDPDPDTFFANLMTYADLSSVVRHHILPTWIFTSKDLTQYDKVYRTEQIGELANDLSEITGKDVSLKRANKSKTRLDFEELTPHTQNLLRPFLADEYRYLSAYFDNPFEDKAPRRRAGN